ncbi:HNS domain-containing protein [Paraburkholderia tropica]|uniref:H-NS histone family protein n=1 Tax=Paraburkholderia tropica TaxID=92647 RepID=UPI001CAE8110|nr:H-NS histone family protein [Paraburkholderia tropica]CAG9207655.1 HNS domain-containing protein [Paraburkholderia tropica]
MSDLKELLAQREQLESQLAAAFKEERSSMMAQIIEKMKQHRITIEEIRGPVLKEKLKLPAKYRHPTTGAEWSGRGKPPNWIKDVPDRSIFLIKR